jgi:DNA-binding MurR/RpiR family transcriptional regulator
MSEAQVASWLAAARPDEGLSPKLQNVYHVLEMQAAFASYASAGEVAERAGVNIATVTRCAQGLGFSGWPHLQSQLRTVYLSSRFAPQTNGQPESQVHASLERDSENLRIAAQTLDSAAVRGFVDTIGAAERTVVLGFGSHAAVGHVLALLGANRGLNITMIDSGGVQLANTLASLTDRDCLLAISFWQYYRDTTTAVEIAKQAGAPVCVLTDSSAAPAALLADHILVVPTEGLSSFPSMTAALSVAYGLLAELVAQRPQISEEIGRKAADLLSRMNLVDRS